MTETTSPSLPSVQNPEIVSLYRRLKSSIIDSLSQDYFMEVLIFSFPFPPSCIYIHEFCNPCIYYT